MNKGKLVIKEFIKQLNNYKNYNLIIDKWPDEINRNTKEIDALVKFNQKKIAIEHTSIDVLPDQRKDDSIYFQVVTGLREELKEKLKYRITIIIESYSIKKGYNYKELREKFKNWLVENVPALPFEKMRAIDSELPFKFKIKKEKLGKNKIAIGRNVPFDNTLVERLSKILIEKSEKLYKYEKKGYKTVILIENNDIQLMSSELIFNAIQDNKATFNKNSVDEIWFADTSIENNYEFWLLNDRNLEEKITLPCLLR